MNRRTFVKASSSTIPMLGLGPLSILPALKDHATTILFQGDSITDAGRNKGGYYANDRGGMGSGYVAHVTTELLGEYPDANIRVYNRGISGHKVFQLANRWEDDCLQLKPDILSVMIGVNDFWHTLSHDYKGTPDTYRSDFIALLQRTRDELPDVKIIIAEPFFVRDGSAIDNAVWDKGFPIYQQYAKEVSDHFNASFIPLQSIFNDALKIKPVSYWCPDGVHPSMAGSHMMAEAWKKELIKLL